MTLKALRMTKELIKQVEDQAKKEDRSFSNMVRVLIVKGLKHSE